MNDDKHDIESLIKSAFKAIKGTKPKPLGKTEVMGTFGADLTDKIDAKSGHETIIPEEFDPKNPDKNVSKGMLEASKAAHIFPDGIPEDFRAEYLTLTNATGLLLGAFVAINVAYDPKSSDEYTEKLLVTAQGLCRRAASVLKELKTVQFAISRPDANADLTIQIINEQKDK
jgi:hypothetical protein